uniref:ABC1 atypical kinase-like domain-containing protein n=1 Tax=Ditylum brightwellii TaxID=49249 RepID=A0A6V2P8T6_9STRA|mmetsp:Transcript_19216/g.28187  ORF Transcript_19216/g.28187 Transcript_19216/m.28187 type:complete len:847 (+) Transcript_19216:128-2668(+)
MKFRSIALSTLFCLHAVEGFSPSSRATVANVGQSSSHSLKTQLYFASQSLERAVQKKQESSILMRATVEEKASSDEAVVSVEKEEKELVVAVEEKKEEDIVVESEEKEEEKVEVTSKETVTEEAPAVEEKKEVSVEEYLPEEKMLKSKEAPAVTEDEIAEAVAAEAASLADALLDDTCEVPDDGEPDALCTDEETRTQARSRLRRIVSRTLGLVRSSNDNDEELGDLTDAEDELGLAVDDVIVVPEGELLEQGWEKRGNSSALRRNAEVWKFALKCVFKALKPRKMRKKGAAEEEIDAAKTEAAIFIRDGLLRLGPTFVKLGQVISTRTDVLPSEYTDVLKTLQDDVPGFSGKRAKEIISREFGKPCDDIFTDFSEEPLAAASLGQVHTATYKGRKVAIKVQRAGLKELFDVDLKNLKKLAELLDKFDPKTDGADRDWVSIYEESERLLYLEIDYINEAENSVRFSRDFVDVPWVRVPEVYRDVSTPRVLTMEFVESFKLTNIARIEQLGLDKKLLAKRTADAFCRQIIETGYFHCDPHPGNLCVDDKGNLVYYDYGMMDELKPNVRSGFRKFCTALFAGGPMINDIDLAKNAKMLVDGVEEAGVLARGADRLAVEKLARFFMRSFKNKQLGKTNDNIKQTIGTDLQTLTENNVFRFPSTFTFIFRSFASIDGIGKGLDADYDIGKLAQPFVETFTETQKGYKSDAEKNFNIFSRATGLNKLDINTAITTPKKIAYIEETLRAMENGSLKVRVRSLENEKALERMVLTQGRMENILLASVLLNVAGIATRPLFTAAGLAGAAVFGLQAFTANSKIKKFDKTQAKFTMTKFDDDDKKEEKKEDKGKK